MYFANKFSNDVEIFSTKKSSFSSNCSKFIQLIRFLLSHSFEVISFGVIVTRCRHLNRKVSIRSSDAMSLRLSTLIMYKRFDAFDVIIAI